MVTDYYNDNNRQITVKRFGVLDQFVKNGSVASQLELNGLSVDNLIKTSKQLTQRGEDYE